MSYRNPPTEPTEVCDVTSETQLHILNGTICEFSIPCSYVVPVEGTDETELVDIHLTAEGYRDPVLVVDVIPDGLTWDSWIDPDDDHIIRLVLSPQCPGAIDRNLTCNISLLITRAVPDLGDRTDAVIRGPLLIEAGAIAGNPGALPTQSVAAAANVSVDVTDFDGILSNADTDLQSALETIDDHTHTVTAAAHTHTAADLPAYPTAGDTIPAGVTVPYAGAAAPAGWLLCNGAAVNRTTYAGLFSVIQELYGAGDGSTTFNVPDLRGRVPVGRDSNMTEFDTLGESGGETTHTLTTAELASHYHTMDAGATAGSGSTAAVRATTDSYAAALATEVNGSGTAHNNLQPYRVLNFIIKT